MQRQQPISAKRLKRKVGTRQQVIIDEVGPTVAKGRTQGRRPGDRRRGLCGEPAPAAGRRDRRPSRSSAPTNTTCTERGGGWGGGGGGGGSRWMAQASDAASPRGTIAPVSIANSSAAIVNAGVRYTTDAERPHEHPRLHEPPPAARSRSSIRSSSTTPIAPLTRTSLTPGRSRHGSSSPRQGLAIAATCCKPRLALEQIERRIRGRTRERVRHVGRPVHQRVRRVVRPERLEHVAPRRRRGERQGPAGQCLGQGDDVRHDPGASHANIAPVRPNPVKISSKISSTS